MDPVDPQRVAVMAAEAERSRESARRLRRNRLLLDGGTTSGQLFAH